MALLVQDRAGCRTTLTPGLALLLVETCCNRGPSSMMLPQTPQSQHLQQAEQCHPTHPRQQRQLLQSGPTCSTLLTTPRCMAPHSLTAIKATYSPLPSAASTHPHKLQC